MGKGRTERGFRQIISRRRLSFIGLATLAFLLTGTSSAWASVGHVYDPALSLTGNCEVSSDDGVPDPGPCPGVSGVDHPVLGFEVPCGTATDRHGDIYVATPANSTDKGRIDVFAPDGTFLTEIKDEFEPCSIAVDSKGNVYARQGRIGHDGIVFLYRPSAYPPDRTTSYEETVAYDPADHGNPGGDPCLLVRSVAVDPTNDHLYLAHICWIEEYGSPPPVGPPSLIEEKAIVPPAGYGLKGVDVYGANHDVYASAEPVSKSAKGYHVFLFSGVDKHLKCDVTGTEIEGKAVPFAFGLFAAIAVDQSNGDFYVFDYGSRRVDRFSVEGEECHAAGRLPVPPQLSVYDGYHDLAVDDPVEEGEAGYSSPNAGYVYVTSGQTLSESHLFAFRLKVEEPPRVRNQEVTDITETEAILRAQLNPGGLSTSYRFEYVTQADFEANGYANASTVPVPDAFADEGGSFTPVSEPLAGLEPGVSYRFRLVATNSKCPPESPTVGEDESGEGCKTGEDEAFATYPPTPVAESCPNEGLRTGRSAALPDCRAYELVTPPDTIGRIPTMTMLGNNFGNNGFHTPLASPDGASVTFGSINGSLPGIGGGGYKDTFVARREEGVGWRSEFTGIDGAQAEKPRPGGISSDHGYGFWFVEGDRGSLSVDGYQYLHVPPAIEPSPHCAVEAEPEHRFEWLGCGSLGRDPYAQGLWIGPGGAHVVFETGRPSAPGSVPVELESCGPPNGVRAIYDRLPGGPTRCVSVPPAGASAETEAEFQTQFAYYMGASADGGAVAFRIGQAMYVGAGEEETLEVATGEPAFGGLSGDGSRVFFLKAPSGGTVPQGELFTCDLAGGPCAGPGAQAPIQIGSGGESTLVNVSEDGSHAYFVSPQQLDAENKGVPGKDNLYAWDEESNSIDLVATVDAADVSGEFSDEALAIVGGLGLWTGPGHVFGSSLDPSRTSPDGKTLVFESQAPLTGYESGGRSEVFRYTAAAPASEHLLCLSCNPTKVPARSDAQLQVDPSGRSEFFSLPPVNQFAAIPNVSANGKQVFFQTADRLVNADLDGKVDIYEWEAPGGGGCALEGGCLALISAGRSAGDDYLYAATPDGSNVIFLSTDMLVPEDSSPTPSLYDARAGGGFPAQPSQPGPCLGEACQAATAGPDDPTPASSSFEGRGDPTRRRACPKGRHRTSAGSRCVGRHKHRGRHRHHHPRGKRSR
jgi:hypothetical protein